MPPAKSSDFLIAVLELIFVNKCPAEQDLTLPNSTAPFLPTATEL